MKRIKNKLFLFIALFFFSFHIIVFASNFTLSPDTLIVEKNKSFVVSFYISDNEKAINALSAQINYPKDLLKLTSFSKSGSIIQMWSDEPSFSNTEGAAHFEGVILNPGFSGKKGLVVTASFLPLESGVATVKIVSGNIYANDGNATDVLSLLGSATYTIIDKKKYDDSHKSEKEIVPVTSVISDAMSISSPTHPSENVWYQKTDVSFYFSIPQKGEEVGYSFLENGKDPFYTKIDATTTNLSFMGMKDGEYLFSLKEKQSGIWKKIGSYIVRVDTVAPYDVTVDLPYGNKTTKIIQKVYLSAKDSLSGVSYFEISLNKSAPLTVDADSSGTATIDLPRALLGNNSLDIIAYDKAHNSSKTSTTFEVLPLDIPKVDSYTENINAGNSFSLGAKTYPNAKVLVTLKNKNETIEKIFQADENGLASFVTLLSHPGVYTVSIKTLSFENGESFEKNIGNVHVAYSLFWLSSFLTIYGVLLLILFVAILFTALHFYFVTRKSKKLIITTLESNVQQQEFPKDTTSY